MQAPQNNRFKFSLIFPQEIKVSILHEESWKMLNFSW